MADERVTLRGLAGEYRMCHTGGLVTKLEALADAGHFIARRVEPGEACTRECDYLVYDGVNERYHVGRFLSDTLFFSDVPSASEHPADHGELVQADEIAWAIPLADLAPEGER